MLEAAGISDVPRFSIRKADGDHYRHGGRYAQPKESTKGWPVVPIPEALFTSANDVAMAFVIAAVNLKLRNDEGYLSRSVVELLRKAGVDTKGGNKYGAGREAIPYVAENGVLAAWIEANSGLLAQIALMKAKAAAMPRNRPIGAKKPKSKPMNAATEAQLKKALSAANDDYNDAVARAEEQERRAVEAEADAEKARAEANTKRDRIVELDQQVEDLQTENARLKAEAETARADAEKARAEAEELRALLAAARGEQPTEAKPPAKARKRRAKAQSVAEIAE